MQHSDSSDQDYLYYVGSTQQRKLRVKHSPILLPGFMLLYLSISFARQEETRLFALTAQKGRVAWSRVLPLSYTSNVKVLDEGVFVWSRRDDKPETLFAFNHEGKKLWEYRGDFLAFTPRLMTQFF